MFRFVAVVVGVVLSGVALPLESEGSAGLRIVRVSWGDEVMPVGVWYPTNVPERPVRIDVLTLSVAMNAPVASGALPLIVWSHGTGGGMFGHRELAAALARAGFIVAAPTHAGDNFQDNRFLGKPERWSARAEQLSATIDTLLVDPAIGPHIDITRIGVAGFSAGGTTALTLGGARPNPARHFWHCGRHAADDPLNCDFGPAWFRIGRWLRGLGPEPKGGMEGLADSRIKAIAALEPAGVFFDSETLNPVDVPILLYRGGASELSHLHNVQHVADALPEAPTLLVEEAAHHLGFLDPFPEDISPVPKDPPGFDRIDFLPRLYSRLASFFDAALFSR